MNGVFNIVPGVCRFVGSRLVFSREVLTPGGCHAVSFMGRGSHFLSIGRKK